jgi:asparagine N-glycosylation enzyme membrane subunit Stt3
MDNSSNICDGYAGNDHKAWDQKEKVGKQMNRRLTIAFAFIFLTALCSMAVKPSQAQTNPVVPEFTLQIVEDGVQITIQNQPAISNGHENAGIYYDIRLKWHDSTNWVHTTVPDSSRSIRGYIGAVGTSGSTVIQKDAGSIKALLGPSSSAQVDFQVDAINGYLNTSAYGRFPIGADPNSYPVVVVNTSSWSNTQTITIPEAAPTSSISPSISSLYILVALMAIVIALMLAIIVVKLRRKPKQTKLSTFS